MNNEIEMARPKRRHRAKKSVWSNQTAAWIGFLLARGETSREISNRIKREHRMTIRQESIRDMRKKWDLPKSPVKSGDIAIVPIGMGSKLRAALSKEAADRNMETDEFVALVLKTINKDDMWKAVLDEG